MKDIQRKPNPIFLVTWTVWYANVLAALLLPAIPIYSVIVLALFLIIEGIAVWQDTGSRDTLSEIATWLIRKSAKNRDFARGWNAMLLMVVLTIAYVFGRLIYVYSGVWPLAVILAGLMAIWLYDHWVSPDIYG